MIEVQNMSFCYGKKLLFNDLKLSLQAGRLCGLLGLNGAGKSTLMKLLCGLLFPTQGQVWVFGEEPVRRSPELLSRLFMLSEEIYIPSVSGQDYLNARVPLYPRFDRVAFEHYATELELPSFKQKLNRLSYGQKKKFLLAFGLASGTDLLLLDEPTNGLDIPSKASFRRLLVEAIRPERSFIISTHQVGDIRALVDSVIIVHEGKILFNHSTEEIELLLHMKRSDTAPAAAAPGLLYSEATASGYWSVWEGPETESNLLDLEILFNAVLSNKKMADARPANDAEIKE